MLVLTGAAGFIGSVVLGYLNKQGIHDIIVVDDIDLEEDERYKNLIGKRFKRHHIIDQGLPDDEISCVIHIGANANTLERNWDNIYRSNVISTWRWSEYCKEREIPFIYTSTAAIYGNGNGPLNYYAETKKISEEYVDGVILRLFNVYGPNEYHKGRMASTIYNWWTQVNTRGYFEIFKGSDNFYRDFIYVEDVARIIYHFMNNYKRGTYDIGTGISTDFQTISNIFTQNYQAAKSKYIKMPIDLEKQYQKNTKADIKNLRESGFDVNSLIGIEEGINQYFTYLGDKRL
jgi:ADP-L-glycero-D-manno-heptose 6-epimerase